VRPEGFGTLKKFIHLIGSRTRDLPACSKVRVSKEAVVAYSRHNPGIYLDGLREQERTSVMGAGIVAKIRSKNFRNVGLHPDHHIPEQTPAKCTIGTFQSQFFFSFSKFFN
jgi:hypothetical protein